MSEINEINECFKRGILPPQFDFTKIQTIDDIDWNRVRYNTFGRDENWIMDNLIPKAIHTLPGIEKIVEELKKNTLTPLEEIELRQNIKISDNNIKDEC